MGDASGQHPGETQRTRQDGPARKRIRTLGGSGGVGGGAYPEGSTTGSPGFDFVHPDDLARASTAFEEARFAKNNPRACPGSLPAAVGDSL
jgi:hypothetical protein